MIPVILLYGVFFDTHLRRPSLYVWVFHKPIMFVFDYDVHYGINYVGF